MVVFVCTQCNATLKKSNARLHLQSSRPCSVVSCVDCHKDFDKSSVDSHCVCISEKEKYDKARFMESSKNDKSHKQAEWIVKIEDLIKNCKSTKHKKLLENLRGASNVPKKKKKFQNFMKSKYRGIPSQTIDEIWGLLETVKPVSGYNVSSVSQKRSTVEIQNEKPKPKKQKLDVNGCASHISSDLIKEILAQFGDQTSFKVLSKKMYCKYKTSIPSTQECMTKKEFKVKLSDFIQNSNNLTYSPTDGMVRIVDNGLSIKTNSHGTLDSNSDSNKITESPIGQDDEAHKCKKIKKIALTILRDSGGRIPLKKLVKKIRKQIVNQDDQTVGHPTKDELKEKVVNKINKSHSMKLSDDGKWVEICS
ncbi:unnamed protein product [Heterobilharzia americana]|nr:unnamed protein product [Heterobilharzia americana]